MNNLKFRAFDPATKRMIKPSFDLVIEFHTNPFGEAYTVVFVDNKRIENAIVMQSTGLKDKHNVEIYEGDIVELEPFGFDKNSTNPQQQKSKVEVKYQITNFDKDARWSHTQHSFTKCKVIGNIYDNPELLEVKNGFI